MRILSMSLVAGLAVTTVAMAGPPDLSGNWTNASVTKLTRLPGAKGLVVDKAEAARLASEAPMVRATQADASPTKTAEAPPVGGAIGGYNTYWMDAGSTLGQVKGEYRTSWIMEPDGQLPLSDAGKALVAKAQAFARAADAPAGPEGLQPWDRCLIASRGSGGPGMLNNIYNSNYQIVQTPTSVAIVVEMVHDARTIPLFASKAAAQAGHGPAALKPWLGDSVGWFEGDTLVVETVNVNPEQGRAGPIFLTPQGKVTERFRRASPKEIFYAFSVEDPAYYTRPWTAEMSLTAIEGQVYEYACHEGNYALPGILGGARRADMAAAGSGSAP